MAFELLVFANMVGFKHVIKPLKLHEYNVKIKTRQKNKQTQNEQHKNHETEKLMKFQ